MKTMINPAPRENPIVSQGEACWSGWKNGEYRLVSNPAIIGLEKMGD